MNYKNTVHAVYFLLFIYSQEISFSQENITCNEASSYTCILRKISVTNTQNEISTKFSMNKVLYISIV